MIHSILCAIDVNEAEAEKPLLRAAARIAAADGARMDVITVVPDYGMSVVGSFFESEHTQQVVDHAKEVLEALTKEVLGAEAAAEIRHIVAVGSAYVEVLKGAEAAGSDLIVIGAHKPDLHDYLLGPNAARVVRHSKCSVYVVRGSTI